MKLSEIKTLLTTAGIRLTRSLGQSFLHDGNQLRRIVQRADLRERDRVLEIGPGLGPLTELLLARSREVLAIEKDKRLVELLRHRLGPRTNLRLVNDDALNYLKRSPGNWSEWKMVSNLPYSVASPLLVELCRPSQCPALIVATVQLEVAQRICAQAGSAAYGLLSLLLQIRYRAEIGFKIPSSCFFPPPEVDSACVTLMRRNSFPLAEAEIATFKRIARRSFGQRRKMMLKLLRQDWPGGLLEKAFAQLNLGPTARAEELTLDQFVGLARLLHGRDAAGA